MKSPKCIVHIGMHKTGSTSIQRTLANGVTGNFYPVVMGKRTANLSVTVYSLFMDKGIHHKHHRQREHDHTEFEEFNRKSRIGLEARFAECGQRTAIMSGEDMSRLDTAAVTRFKHFLEPWFEEIQIVAYARPPKSFMESAFQQILKGGQTKLDTRALYPHYQSRFGPWIDVFGPARVSVRPFIPSQFPNQCAVTDFAQHIGMPIDPAQIVRTNESLSLEAVQLLYAYRVQGGSVGLGTDAMRSDRKLVEFLAGMGGGKLRFSPTLVQPVLDEMRDDIAWVEQLTGVSMRESTTQSGNMIESEADLLSIPPKAAFEMLRWLREFIASTADPEEQEREARRKEREARAALRAERKMRR